MPGCRATKQPAADSLSLSLSHILMRAHHAAAPPAFHTASPTSLQTMGLLCSLSMHVNGGMSRFVFSLFYEIKKKKSFQLKLAASLDIIMLISLISTIR